jgi:anti-sigma factor RsiW
VVAWAGQGARLVPAPGGMVTLGEVGVSARGVGVVAKGSDRAFDARQQGGCRLVAGASAGSYVPGPDQNRIATPLPRGRSASPKGRYHHRQR